MPFKLYGAGGAGINIASRLESLRDGSNGVLLDGFSISYLDTSDSNVDHNKINKEHLYLIEGANGSGKNRAENYSIIKEQIKRILLDHKPQDFNVVIHSLSGGSGSVIGPLLANELLDQGKDVVVIIVGSTDSTIEINNSIKTIKSYAGISAKQKKPIVAIYYENN
jgi:cell division GTPase FtsZ